MIIKRRVDLGSLKELIKKVLIKRDSGLNIKQIGWELDLKGSKFVKSIKLALDQLISDVLVYSDKKYKYRYKWPKDLVIGTIEINRAGNG